MTRLAKKSVTIAVLIFFVSICLAQPQNQVKGQAQQSGAYVNFGEVYSLQNGWNFQLIRAYYTLNGMPTYGSGGAVSATDTNKVFVVQFAVKNATQGSKWFGGGEPQVEVYDQNGQKYSASGYELQSNGSKELDLTLAPGQGIGQKDLNNPLYGAFSIPNDAKITKIVITPGRLNKSEDVMRYLIAGTDPAAQAVNTPELLPTEQQDPANKDGITAPKQSAGSLNTYYPTGLYLAKVESITTSTTALSSDLTPDDGKKIVVVTMLIKNPLTVDEDVWPAVSGKMSIVDGDGASTDQWKVVRASSSDDVNSGQITGGNELHVRVLFQIASGATPKQFIYAVGSGHPWVFDIKN